MAKTVLLQVLTAASLLAQPRPEPASADSNLSGSFRLEREPASDSAELVTLFGRFDDPTTGEQALDVPLVTVLRDTLGVTDPAAGRLRFVWILTSTRPTPWQRVASTLSFFRFRAGGKHHANRIPSPALNLASPGKTVWTNLVGRGLQTTQLDPLGMFVRASTRSYSGNFTDYRMLHIYQALSALDGLERSPDPQSLLPLADQREMYSRLTLSGRTLGGLVRLEKLPAFYDKDTSERSETRGHNWELLRQRAELCGLYFQPLALPDAAPGAALLWIAREDLGPRANHRFERQFLNIVNPWTDERLRHWTGYTQVRYFDEANRPVSADTPGAHTQEMIPLALYSLDHPRAPLLLADFRDNMKIKRGELLRHGANTLLTGVFGITRLGNWPFFAADSTYTFVRSRHGAAVDRSARLRAYSDARSFIALDASLDPKLKIELLHRLDHLALNPLENGISTEATVAKEQYAALLAYAKSPDGLAARLNRDRRKELDSYTHSRAKRMLAGIGNIFTHGPRTEADSELLNQLAAYRRTNAHTRFLEFLLAQSPRPDVVWNAQDIRLSVDAVRSPRLIAEVFARSSDPDLRFTCLRALQRLDRQDAQNELWRLAQDPGVGDSWRAICLRFFNREPEPTGVAASAGQQ